MMKTVTKNSVEVAKTSELRGFLDEYGDSDADILFLEGEIHSDTKPVSAINTSLSQIYEDSDLWDT